MIGVVSSKRNDMAAIDYHRLYKSARWQRIRVQQLQQSPLCIECLSKGLVVPAEVVDHVDRHNGNVTMFYMGKLQSLCKQCHDGRKQQEEKIGFYTDIGVNGWPTDRRHPVYNLSNRFKRHKEQM